MLTTDEKAAAFDLLVLALTNRWHDGAYSAWCQSLVEQPNRASRGECVPDLLAWAERAAKVQQRKDS
jgi:hypothetical protein